VVEGRVAQRRNVTLGDTFGDRIAILSGVTAGEVVISRGASAVENGETVQVVP
jgi:multidrug efflux pump subunit AcrA (membrane-fusion protein)